MLRERARLRRRPARRPEQRPAVLRRNWPRPRHSSKLPPLQGPSLPGSRAPRSSA